MASPTAPSPARTSPARRVAVAVLVLVGVGIAVIGARFLLQPAAAADGFGLPASPADPFLTVKGIRDIGAGLMLLVVLGVAGARVAAWLALAAAVIPLGDMIVVLAGGGPVGTALGVHGATCLVMVAAAAVVLLGSRTADAGSRSTDAGSRTGGVG